MITNKSSREYRLQQAPRQRLGDKEAYTSLVPNQNGNYIRYFSSIDAEIYFGDIFIDDVFSISYQVMQNAQPIYGYNSYIYDDIALGARIVDGRFSINFTKSGYMYEVIDTLKAINNANSGVKRNAVDEHNPLWTTPATLNNLKAGFDIYVSFGDGRQTPAGYNSSVTVLKNVTLTGCSVELNAQGEPIRENYAFTARDIDFLTNGISTTSQTEEVAPTQDPIVALTYNASSEKLSFNFKNNIRIGGLIVTHKDLVPSFKVIAETADTTQMAQYTYQVKDNLARAIKKSHDENRLELTPITCMLIYEEDGQTRNWQGDMIIAEYVK